MKPIQIVGYGCPAVGLAVSAAGETPLSRVFAGLRDPDPAVRDRANDSIVSVVEQEMPHIEDDAALLCGALSDPDPYVRQQASAIFAVIPEVAPKHDGLLVTCRSGLLTAATDSARRVRDNSLQALLHYPFGPPPEAQPVFAKALQDANDRFAMLGAAGLLQLTSHNRQANADLVRSALLSTTDANRRTSLLKGIADKPTPDAGLFQTATDLLYKAEPEDADLLMKAVVATAPTKAQANTTLRNYSESASGSPGTRKAAADLAQP